MNINFTSEKISLSRDILGRYMCNSFDEALLSTNSRADARPFDYIIIGGGTFGSALAELSPVGSKGTTLGRNRSLLVGQNLPPGFFRLVP